MNYIDSASLYALQNSKSLSNIAYKTALVSTEPFAPGMLHFFCILYNKIFNDASKEAILTLFKEDSLLKPYYKKYEMLSVLCQHETIDPMVYIHEHKNIVDPLLTYLGLDREVTQSFELFKETMNKNILHILDYIKLKKQDIISMLSFIKIKGGTRKHSKRKHSKRRLSKHG